MATQYVTKSTFEKMKADLHHLKSVERPAASAAIAEAREKGDLKENAEYDAAKEAQGMLEAKISMLDDAVSNARIVDESTIDTSKASILTKVTVTNVTMKKQFTYQLVSESEANLKEGKISISSPIGQGLLGKKVGDTAEITVPAGKLTLKIDNITL